MDYRKIEEKLGFDKIRGMVMDECTNAMALDFAGKMSFSNDYDGILHSLRQTDELREILLVETAFPSQDFFDLSETLSYLTLEGTVIEQAALFDLKTSLSTISECLNFFLNRNDEKYPELRSLAGEVCVDPSVLSDCNRIVDDKGEIYDKASDNLALVRKQLQVKHADIDRQISKTLSRAKQEGWAPENAEVTFRNGRMVIPMLDTHRRKIKGLIHDESATRQTAYLEPAEVVELNNDLRELEFAEQREIHKILLAFTEKIRPLIPQLLHAYRFLATLDFIRAKARFALSVNALMPVVVNHPKMTWFGTRHPLLYLSMQKQNKEVVPFNVELSEQSNILIISGPNSGGKSVCLKAMGLLQYMLQSGLLVTAKTTSEFGIFDKIFIDIGDQQSIENDLSTYSSHLLNVKTLVSIADDRTLFLLDEFGAGTEPRIGGAIAEAVLEDLYAKNAWGVVTTHYANLKLLADRLPRIANAAMLFDTQKMLPLYRLSLNHPGSSFAFEIAKNIGLPDEILANAESKVGGEMLNFEQQLQQIEVEKLELAKRKTELDVADDFLNEVVRKYNALNADLENKKYEILSKARAEARQIIADANRKVEKAIADIKLANAQKEETQRIRENLKRETETIDRRQDAAERKLKLINGKAPEKTAIAGDDIDDSPLEVGDIAKIEGYDSLCQVVEIKGGKAVVESNSVRMTIAVELLQKTHKKTLPKAEKSDDQRFRSIYGELNKKRAAFSATLDVRGKRVEEALSLLEKYIDEAQLLSEKEFRILHGKGFGILKTVLRDYLRTNRNVQGFRSEILELGGEGITIVNLK